MIRAIGLLTIAALIGLWEFVATTGAVDEKLIPAPSLILDAAVEMAASGELVWDLVASMERWTFGFAYGVVLGVSLGVATGRSVVLRQLFEPTIQLLRPVPAIAFVPVAIIWFGIGEESKHFLVAWGAFFPIWVNTHVGTARVDPDYLWAARSLGATEWQILRSVVLPASLPFIFAGVRVGIAVGFICLVAAEMAGAFNGLGYRITASHMVFRLDRMFVALILLGVIGTLTDRAFYWGSLRLFPWLEMEMKGSLQR